MNHKLFPRKLSNINNEIVEEKADWTISIEGPNRTETTIRLPYMTAEEAFAKCIDFKIPVEKKHFGFFKWNQPKLTISRNNNIVWSYSSILDMVCH